MPANTDPTLLDLAALAIQVVATGVAAFAAVQSRKSTVLAEKTVRLAAMDRLVTKAERYVAMKGVIARASGQSSYRAQDSRFIAQRMQELLDPKDDLPVIRQIAQRVPSEELADYLRRGNEEVDRAYLQMHINILTNPAT
jgi:hypothetical protein